jgi:hypothetical protein
MMALLLPMTACKKEGGNLAQAPQPAAPANATHGAMPAKKEALVVVPDTLKGKWKAVRIVVVEIASKKETAHIVPVGSDFPLSGTGLTLRVENLLPDFTMGSGVITSKSESMENPAAQVKIIEGGKDSFKGWMFAKFPDTHSYQHPKYALKLVDFVP